MIKDNEQDKYFEDKEKEETYDEKDVQTIQEIISYLKLYPNGISHEQLFKDIKLEKALLAKCLNHLFVQGRLINDNKKEGENILKLLTEKEILKLKDLSGEESHVYEVILASGNNGITLNELKSSVGLTGNALSKIRKKLEKRLLVKNITIPNMKNKKVILAYDVEPSNELKGGFWCTNQQFDKSLIETISSKILEYLSKQTSSTRKEILIFIKSTGLVNSEIKEDDIQNIINLLVFDDKIDIVNSEELGLFNKGKYSILLTKKADLTMSSISVLNNLKYKIVVDLLDDFNILQSVPCTYCPSIRFCDAGNKINPIDCPYLNQFYQQDYISN